MAAVATAAARAVASAPPALATPSAPAPATRGGKDIGFAVGIVLILCLFFLPVPAFAIDFGLAFSIALSVLILMVALWINKPLEFSPSRPCSWWRRS